MSNKSLQTIIGKLYLKCVSLKKENELLTNQNSELLHKIEMLKSLHKVEIVKQNVPYCICKNRGVYDELNKMYYCPTSNVWLETSPNDYDCQFCFNGCHYCTKPPSTLKMKEEIEKAPDTLRSIPSHKISEKPITVRMI